MWQILRAEFSYNKILFLSLFSFVPVLAYVTIHPPIEDFPVGIMMFWLMFMTAQFWIIFRNKENRDYQQVRLPVSTGRIALVRLGMVAGFCVSMIALCCAAQVILNPGGPIVFKGMLVAFGIILLPFSTYFILRDLILFFLRNNRVFKFTKERTITVLIFVGLLLNLLGVYYFFVGLRGPEPSSGLIRMIRFVKYDPLFTTELGIAKFLTGCLIFSGLSVVTFAQRKSYLE